MKQNPTCAKNAQAKRELRQSGIEWIGEIPKGWSLERLQWHMTEINVTNNPTQTKQVLSLTNKLGVIPYEEKGNQGNKAKTDYSEYKLAYPNTIVANSMNIIIGSVGISNYFGCVSPVYYVFKPNKNENLKYINYIMQTEAFQKELRRYANGILEIRLRLSASDILKRPIPYPPLEEQEKIAGFLDRQCALLDRIISQSQQSIHAYKRYKQSLITECVTQGLENAPKRASGIEWIGAIPTHWEIKKLKYLANIRSEQYTSAYGNINYFGLENIESQSGQYVTTSNEYDLTQSQICKCGDIVFGKLRPYLAKVYKVTKLQCCSTEFAVFYNFKGVCDYYKYVMLSHWFINIVNSSTYGTKMPRANINFINNMPIPFPPLEEQQRIVAFLDAKCEGIERVLEKKAKLIELCERLKKSLIYEYTTGKKEVHE